MAAGAVIAARRPAAQTFHHPLISSKENTVQKPSIGRIVLVPMHPADNNGQATAPAIITRVWSQGLVNVRVFPDDSAITFVRTSVSLFEDDEDASAVTGLHTAWWPPRV